jgi:hypothetical protein
MATLWKLAVWTFLDLLRKLETTEAEMPFRVHSEKRSSFGLAAITLYSRSISLSEKSEHMW